MNDPTYETLNLRVPKHLYKHWLKAAKQRHQTMESYLNSVLSERNSPPSHSSDLAGLPVSEILKLTKPAKKPNRIDFYK